MNTLAEIEKSSLNLSQKERAQLALRLMESLDSEESTDNNYDELWAAELDKREGDLASGKARLISTAEAEKNFRS